jgi:hypothetical protein
MINASGALSLILVYESDSTNQGPIPITNTADPRLIRAVAERAISDATSRVNKLSFIDEVLGELEVAELERLTMTLNTLIPGLQHTRNPVEVM